MFVFIVVIVIIVAVIGLVLTGYLETGFGDKTLWDWIEVVGIPVVVVIIAGWFGTVAKRAGERNEKQREIDIDRDRETTLRTYLDVMPNLVIEHKLKSSEEDSPERAVANAQTFMALRTLDGRRKLVLLQFLKESGLIDKGKPIISLNLADLTSANLSSVDLSGTCLRGINLKDADLSYANLSNADLSDAVLIRADLRGADLSDTDLRNVDLSDALVEREQLDKSSDTSGSLLPEGISENTKKNEN